MPITSIPITCAPLHRSISRMFRDIQPRRLGSSSSPFVSPTLLSLLLLSLSAVGCTHPEGQPALAGSPGGLAPATVEVAAVEYDDVTPQLTLVGTVMAARRSVLGSAVDGRVVRVEVEAGDVVAEAGQPVAQLMTETISLEIGSANAQLELRRQRLAELEAGTRDEEITQAKARWEAAKAAAKYARARFARLESLYEQARTVSQEEFDEAISAAQAAEQELMALRAAYDLAAAGPRVEQIQQARASVAQQEEDVKRLEDMRRKHTIRAPFEGYVLEKHTEVGAWLSRGDPVAEIAELDPVDIEVQVPESLVSDIHLGDVVPITIDALPEESNVFEGEVHRIVPSADLQARTFPVRMRLRNPRTGDGHRLKHGMLARVTVSGRSHKALLVSKDALILGQEQPALMVVGTGPDGQPIARRVSVEVGVEFGSMIEVRGNVQPGDLVITRGNERVQPRQVLIIVSDDVRSEA